MFLISLVIFSASFLLMSDSVIFLNFIFSLCNAEQSEKNRSNSGVNTSVQLTMNIGYLIYQRKHTQSMFVMFIAEVSSIGLRW